MVDIDRVIHEASSWKAPEKGGKLAVVRQKLCPVVKEAIFHIFHQSDTTGRLPYAFKPDYKQL